VAQALERAQLGAAVVPGFAAGALAVGAVQ